MITRIKSNWILPLWGATVIFTAQWAVAQPQPPGGDSRSRTERIKEHQDRIQKIIEESKKRREEQNAANAATSANPPAAPGNAVSGNAAGSPVNNAAGQIPGMGAPGQPLPTGPVQNQRMAPPIQKAQATPAPQAPQAPRSESRTILMFSPIDSIVGVGEEFKTDIVAETKEGVIDEFSILIRYPRHILNPLALDHSIIDRYIADKLNYEFDPDAGTIYLSAKLKQPTAFAQKAIASLVWEALEPSDGTVISYEFGKDKTTGLYLKGSNLLGTLPGAEDGVIRTTVQVTAPKGKTVVTKLNDKGLLIGAKQTHFHDDRPQDQIYLELKSDKKTAKAGEAFKVQLVVKNPGEKLIDRVRAYVQFDPQQLEVVDSDIGNVITRNINAHDAPYRDQFPFDYNRANIADNSKGLLLYDVSASNSRIRGNGTIASITFRALKDVPRAEVVLVRNAENLPPTSDVSYLGESLLKSPDSETAVALSGVAVAIKGQMTAAEINESEPQKVFNPFASPLAQRAQGNIK